MPPALALTAAVACGDSGGDASTTASTTGATTRSSTVSEDQTTEATPTALEATGEGELAGVTLGAELAVEGDVLRVSYRLDNGSDRPLAVADAVPAAAGASFHPDAAGAWVTASTHGFVTIGKWGIGQPAESGNRAAPLPIYMVRAEPGAAVEGTIELDWPLEGNHPYLAPDELPLPLPDPVETVRVCLGVERLVPAIDQAPETQEGEVTWLEVPMDRALGTLCTGPEPIAGTPRGS